MLLYAVAIPAAFVSPLISYALYILVAIMWLVPDRRIEKTLQHSHREEVSLIPLRGAAIFTPLDRRRAFPWPLPPPP